MLYSKLKDVLKKNKKLHSFVLSNKLISRIRLEATPMGFFRNFILFPLRQIIRKTIYCPEYAKKIVDLRNIHKGERCFIVATGPSLTIEDLNLLKNEITIGENSIYKLYDMMGWRPTYYAMADISLTRKVVINEKVNFHNFAKKYCFFNAINRDIIKCQNSIFVDVNWLNHNYKKTNYFRYNPNLEYGIYDFYSITHLCLQLALYMGFNEIYIVGVDNNYFGSKKHVVEEVKGLSSDWTEEEALITQRCHNWGYELINKIAISQNVKIYNATRGGCVTAFQRITLEEVFNK